MSPFLRIGLSNFDSGTCPPSQGQAVSPYCAVLVKESVDAGEWVGRSRVRWAGRGFGGSGKLRVPRASAPPEETNREAGQGSLVGTAMPAMGKDGHLGAQRWIQQNVPMCEA